MDKYRVQHLPKSEETIKIEEAVNDFVNTVLDALYKQQEQKNQNTDNKQ